MCDSITKSPARPYQISPGVRKEAKGRFSHRRTHRAKHLSPLATKYIGIKTKEVENEPQTLSDLRALIKEIDVMRRVQNMTGDEREALELSAVALRDAERVLIAKMQSQFIKDMEKETASLNEQARTIRARVTKMNKMPNKTLDNIQKIIKIAVKIVIAVAKW